MAPETTKSSRKSNSSSKPGKKSTSLVESILSGAFHKDESSSSRSSKRREGKVSKDCTTSESKDHNSGTKYGTKSTKSTSSKTSKAAKSTHASSDTFLESVFFRNESQAPPSTSTHPLQPSQPSQPASTKIISSPPSGPPQDHQHSKPSATSMKSVHVTEKDKEMAKKQLKIEELSEKELEEQETWALEKLIQCGRCPQNWGWERYTAPAGYEKYNGYRCCGSPVPGARHVHMISHELLAEGKGGLYILSLTTNWWDGPFYPGDHENAFAFQVTPFSQTVNIQQMAPGQQQIQSTLSTNDNHSITVAQNTAAGTQMQFQQMQNMFAQLFPGTPQLQFPSSPPPLFKR
ncbi:hypothetical protein ONS95_011504 [Cadophora gregata]|uniref:uncharacterized protein n=1 Tax=Cadophora gregata TaxID=51156 RepID=UPI0026DCBFFF|nr:uncharacterized protein ONS95_011504 [Cadophora gregata]KAK0120091.1 hypothetical protein ONS95_011504 [Cadophora gregata]KAK0121121.1 hypothetical protein ONS96_011303 [Cadophora gregata f. sp. sojae]